MSALWLLVKLKNQALLRQVKASLTTVKGILLALIALGVVLLIVVPNLIVRLTTWGNETSMNTKLPEFLPFLLLVYFVANMVTSIGERAIYFSPAEINYLFTAPFTRRQLLIYKIFGILCVGIFQTAIFSFAMANLIPNLLFGFIGILFTVWFISLTSMTTTLVGQIVAERTFTRLRRLVAFVLVVLIAIAVGQAAASIGPGIEWTDWLANVRQSSLGKIVLAPFNVFSNAVCAANIGTFALWASIALGINLFLIFSIVMLDANYIESADQISQKIHRRMQRVKSSGGWTAKARIGKRNRTLPMPRFWGGAGPLIWRQLVNFLRTSRNLLILGGFSCAGLCIPIYFSFRGKIDGDLSMLGLVFGASAYVSALISLNLPMGFRSEVDLIEHFKSLPIKPLPVAIGQVTGSVVALTFLQWLVVAFAALATQFYSLWWIAGGLALIPFNLIVTCSANALYLHFPISLQAGSRGLQATMQMIFFSIAHMTIIMTCAGIAATIAVVTYLLTSNEWIAFVPAFLILCLLGIVGVWNVAFAYRRFDVSAAPK